MIWFRRDLRITDNTGLYKACQAADQGVVALFTVTPGQWKDHDDAAAKVYFWLQNLAKLKPDLSRLRIPLKILVADDYQTLPGMIASLVKDTQCQALFLNREYEINEQKRDDRVADALAADGIPVHRFDDRTVIPPGQLLNGQGDGHSVFADYRRQWDTELFQSMSPRSVVTAPVATAPVVTAPVATPPIPTLPEPNVQSETGVQSSEIPQTVAGFDRSDYREDLWKPGEQVALERLNGFIKRMGAYARHRDVPSLSGSSFLSPYLAAGVLSPRQCLAKALESCGGTLAHSPGATAWFSEFTWRDFYASLLVAYPRVSKHQPLIQTTNAIEWRHDTSEFRAWCDGRTGYPFVDAGMRQLNRTGWMHNRLRMVTAMFLSKHLMIDWRWGERYFMSKLIDGDLAANNGGWQWSASTGTDSTPYLRVFNPFSQSKRFDPKASYIKRFCPELDSVNPDAIHDPNRLSDALAESKGLISESVIDYPSRIVDHKASRQRVLNEFKRIGLSD